MLSGSGGVFENRNPASTDDLIGLFQKSTREDVDRAIDAAQRAYRRDIDFSGRLQRAQIDTADLSHP